VSEDDSNDDQNVSAREGGPADQVEDGAGCAADQPVGYGQPPERSRFKKGQSGNPKGRGRGTRNLATDVAAAAERRVTVQVDGERREVTAREAMLLSLILKGVNGDIRASAQFFKMMKELGLEAPSSAEAAPVTERDRKIVESFIQRCTIAAKDEEES
jgi:hypothetical protein